MSKLTKALTAAAGNAGESLYVEDVFSTYLYTGTGSTQSINNGIDLDGEGGTVLLQSRSNNTGTAWNVYDTERGVRKYLRSNSTASESTAGTGAGLTSFNSNGFTLGTSWNTENFSPYTYVSWAFRKAEKFFDVVTYTGTTANQAISHSLNSVPGMIIVRALSGDNWFVWHNSLSTSGAGASTGHYQLILNSTATKVADNGVNTVTDSSFTVFGNNGETNYNGTSYVAYVFANDAGGFGDDGSESIIKCGSYTGTGASMTQVEVDLGFEPQWLLLKSTVSDDWRLVDNMRPWSVNSSAYAASLNANTSDQEYAPGVGGPKITSTGFVTYGGNGWSDNGETIYIAIRRPMKTPESGTEVFAVDDRAAATPAFVSDFPVDLYWTRAKTAGNFFDYARLRGDNYLQHDGTNAETSGGAFFDSNTGVGSSGSVSTNHLAWMFKRATGFFDVVAYTGTGSATTFSHNLKAVPELMIVKQRSGSSESWTVWNKTIAASNSAATLWLNSTSAVNNFSNRFNSLLSEAGMSTPLEPVYPKMRFDLYSLKQRLAHGDFG